jgi:hypothetical protein
MKFSVNRELLLKPLQQVAGVVTTTNIAGIVELAVAGQWKPAVCDWYGPGS